MSTSSCYSLWNIYYTPSFKTLQWNAHLKEALKCNMTESYECKVNWALKSCKMLPQTPFNYWHCPVNTTDNFQLMGCTAVQKERRPKYVQCFSIQKLLWTMTFNRENNLYSQPWLLLHLNFFSFSRQISKYTAHIHTISNPHAATHTKHAIYNCRNHTTGLFMQSISL